MVRLVIKKFDGKEEIIPLVKEELRLGRNDPDAGIANEINFTDSVVSRSHARIFFENSAYCIEDLGSANGTYINDKAVTKAKLSHGDQITIGRNMIIFERQGTKTINPLDFVVKDVTLDHHRTIDSNYVILHKLSQLLVTTTNMSDFLQAVLKIVLESIRSASGFLILTDPEGRLKQSISAGKGLIYSEEVVRQALAEKKSLLVGHDLEASKTMMLRGVQSAICAPLLHDQEILGAIYLEDPFPGKFGDEELIMLTLFANQIAAGIKNFELKERLHLESTIRINLERFLSPSIAEIVTKECLAKGEIILETGRVNATVLFSDIQGFTLLSERLDPQEIAPLLNRYFSLMTDIVFACDGTLDKYVGDGLVAVFGAPFPYADHASRAIKAALLMQEQQRRFVEQEAPDRRFRIRIGINSGEMVAGYLGSLKRMEYTVLGEAVIIANRLQSLAEPGSVYFGKETYLAIKDRYPAEFVTRMETPKGLNQIEVYRLKTA
jgi:adenylate cyclase